MARNLDKLFARLERLERPRPLGAAPSPVPRPVGQTAPAKKPGDALTPPSDRQRRKRKRRSDSQSRAKRRKRATKKEQKRKHEPEFTFADLRPYQQRSVEHMRHKDSLLLAYQTGMGKTITAAFAAREYLEGRAGRQVIVVCPVSLIENFKQTLVKKLRLARPLLDRFHFYTLDGIINARLPAAYMIIVDEAHNYRTNVFDSIKERVCLHRVRKKAAKEAKLSRFARWRKTEFKETKETIVAKIKNVQEELLSIRLEEQICDPLKNGNIMHWMRTKSPLPLIPRALAAIRACQKSEKVMLLTATPIVNGNRDLRNLMSMLQRTLVYTTRLWNKKLTGPDQKIETGSVVRFFRAHTHTARRETSGDPDYPEVKVHDVSIVMEGKFLEQYEKMEQTQLEKLDVYSFAALSNPRVFLVGMRQALLVLDGSQKKQWVLDHVSQFVLENNEKVMVFCAFKQAGLDLLTAQLTAMGIKWCKVTGDISGLERQRKVDAFNRGEFMVMLCSAAGGEGLDCKGVNHVIFMDCTWNEATWRQQMGRAVRYRSHETAKRKTVDVWNLIYRKPDGDSEPSSDTRMMELRAEKQIGINELGVAIGLCSE